MDANDLHDFLYKQLHIRISGCHIFTMLGVKAKKHCLENMSIMRKLER